MAFLCVFFSANSNCCGHLVILKYQTHGYLLKRQKPLNRKYMIDIND